MKNTIIISIVVAIVVGSGAFYGGILYGKNQTASARQQRLIGQLGQGGQFNRQGRAGQAGGGLANGDIIAKDDKSITIKLRDGGSKIVFLSGSTEIMKSVDGAVSDLSVGQSVMVSGSTNNDGSITAQAVQLRPAMPVGGSVGPGAATITPQK
jgi:hypothetical protein